MIRKADFASMSVDELWEIHEKISKLLEAKMLAEKKKLERRLTAARKGGAPPRRPEGKLKLRTIRDS
jgi:DNA-binding protein H-NS